MTMSGDSSIPNWLKQRDLGNRKRIRTSVDWINRLNLETTLKTNNYATCLDWNKSGTLLADGCINGFVEVWDPFSRSDEPIFRHQLCTGDLPEIKAVKFAPGCSDKLVATGCSEGRSSMLMVDLETNSDVLKCECFAEPMNRAVRLATHPDEPNLLWTRDSTHVRQHDLREKQTSVGKILYTTSDHYLISLAMNPVRSEMLALGLDGYVRLIDRRFCYSNEDDMKRTISFAAGYPRQNLFAEYMTSLDFSKDGTKLIFASSDPNIYSFDVTRPCERFRSFKVTFQPFIPKCSNEEHQTTRTNIPFKAKPRCLWKDLKQYKPVELPEEHKKFCEEIIEKAKRSHHAIVEEDYAKINKLLTDYKNCAQLYQLRSEVLSGRNYPGDDYQSLRDFCSNIVLRLMSCSLKISCTDKNLQNLVSGLIASNYDPSKEECLWNVPYDAYDYTKRYFCKFETDDMYFRQIKFFGNCDEYIVALNSEYDPRAEHDDFTTKKLYIFEEDTTNLVDTISIGCKNFPTLLPHPDICMLAGTYDGNVVIISPQGERDRSRHMLDSPCIVQD